jgi:hypothetical protein
MDLKFLKLKWQDRDEKETKNKEVFTASNIDVVCPKKMVWDEMDVVGEGKRLCDGCDKVLIDVTNYTKEEVSELQKKDPSLCVAVTNVLVASTLSFSLLSAGGDMEEVNTTVPTETNEVLVGQFVEMEPLPVIVSHVTLGLPTRTLLPPQPICDEGTVNLNAIKRFFGFDADDSCREED